MNANDTASDVTIRSLIEYNPGMADEDIARFFQTSTEHVTSVRKREDFPEHEWAERWNDLGCLLWRRGFQDEGKIAELCSKTRAFAGSLIRRLNDYIKHQPGAGS